MKKATVAGNIIEYFDGDITELPVTRFHAFQKFLLIDAGIGGDLSDVDQHLQRLQAYLAQKKHEEATTEAVNLRQSIIHILQEVTPRHLAFCALVYSVNGREYRDISDEGCRRLNRELNPSLSTKWMDRVVSSVKKKIQGEQSVYFPGRFDETDTKEFFTRMKTKTLLACDAIIRGVDNGEEIKKIENALLTFVNPMTFAGHLSAEVKYIKAFEDACSYLTRTTGRNPKQMTTFEFLNTLSTHGRKPNQGKRSVRG